MSRVTLRKHEMLEAAATMYDLLVEGCREQDIIKTLGIDAETYKELRAYLYELKAAEIRDKSREDVYIEYTIEQRQNIYDLTDLIKNLNEKTQYNAMVGAIRLRSDITDKIITRGQEFGLIRKQPEQRELVAGIFLADLTNDELRKKMAEQNKRMEDMLERYGERDFRALPTGSLHYGEGAIDTRGEELDDESLLDEPFTPPPRAEPARKPKKKRKAAR